MSKKRLIPVTEWENHHSYPTQKAWRFKIFNEEINGLKDYGVVVRIGRRVLIDEDKFFEWVEAQQVDPKYGVTPRLPKYRA